jgi:hypothetical protein
LPCSYYLPDGTPLGKGFTSNTDPYAHFAYNYFDTLQQNPTYNCTYANYYAKYHWVRGAGAVHWLAALACFLQQACILCVRKLPSGLQTHFTLLCPQYNGNSSYLSMQVSGNYNSTTGKNTNSWMAYPCTSTFITICEKPLSAYACPVINDPPEPPASPYCKQAWCSEAL